METTSQKRIIIAHSGKQHSYYVAKALLKLGLLEKFYTSSYISNPVFQKAIQALDLSFLSRRFLAGLGGSYVNAAWSYELKELIYRRLKGNNHKVNELVFERDINFDRDLSKKLPRLSNDVFWGFQGSCHNSLTTSNNLGKESICEMTIAHLPFAKRILEEETRLHPEWADSIDFASFPAKYEQRLIEEPLIAQKVIAISSFLKKTLVQEGVSSEKVSVIPLGFDATAVEYEEEATSISNRPLRLLYAGRITQRKGIQYLLEAIQSFSKKDVELHIIGNIYGSGAAFKKYNNLYTYSKGISQSELFKAYKKYDALVFPSVLEGFGLVTIEAMGAGLPVITTPHTNATEVIAEGVNGFVVPVRNSKAIIDAITHLRNMDNVSFQQMRQQARKTALQYTWEQHTNLIEQFVSKP